MTTATYLNNGTVRITVDGKLKDVPLSVFQHDSELRDVARNAMNSPGLPIKVPAMSYARGLRPRHARVHGLLL